METILRVGRRILDGWQAFVNPADEGLVGRSTGLCDRGYRPTVSNKFHLRRSQADSMGINLSINGIPPHGYPCLANFVNLLDLEYVTNHFGYLVALLKQQRIHGEQLSSRTMAHPSCLERDVRKDSQCQCFLFTVEAVVVTPVSTARRHDEQIQAPAIEKLSRVSRGRGCTRRTPNCTNPASCSASEFWCIRR